jgi:glucose/arabinose dehydrogenase
MFIGCCLMFASCAQGQQQDRAPEQESVTVIAQNLHVPWGMEQLPDGNLLFTERNGRINMLNLATGVSTTLMIRPVNDQAEGGLLGLAVDPGFTQNHFVFIYETTESGNRIVRLTMDADSLREDRVILDGIPRAKYHDGGILKFGPDGYLYAGTGDARQPELAQDKSSLAGKILRIDRNGAAAADNPFNNEVFSYGHRNVQGLAWTDKGELFATEHGPSGELNGWCCHDELNKIIPGGNYGWPKVIGDDNCAGCITPLAHSGEDTWAPGGLIYVQDNGPSTLQGKLVFACLRGQKLLVFDEHSPQPESVLFDETFKRLRNIIQLKDGTIIFSTSNMDGRAAFPDREDDRLIKINNN